MHIISRMIVYSLVRSMHIISRMIFYCLVTSMHIISRMIFYSLVTSNKLTVLYNMHLEFRSLVSNTSGEWPCSAILETRWW